jgi:hypothetical protein
MSRYVRNTRRWPRALIAVLLIGGAMLPASAEASIGAGVGASPIALAQPGHAGGTYSLPGLYVVNTGTVTTGYVVRVHRLSPGHQKVLPAAWVTIERNNFTLRPHRSMVVPLRLRLPAGATPGSYLSNLVASTAVPHHHGGTTLGAAAATKLELAIAGQGSSTPWLRIGLAVAALMVAAAIAAAVRRSGIRLRVERH